MASRSVARSHAVSLRGTSSCVHGESSLATRALSMRRTQLARRRATITDTPSSSHAFSTTPARPIFDALKGLFTNVKDRGLQAIGRETSQDKKMKEVLDRMNALPAKSLQRLQRKRFSAPQTVVDPVTGEQSQRVLEHKYSTAAFRISPKKLQKLADQIGSGKPVEYSILQMQFSDKRAAKRVKSTLALARDHAIAKGLDPARLVVSEAWVGKGRTHKRLEIKGRGRSGLQTRFEARLSVVLREGKTHEERLVKQMQKEKRIVRSIGTGGVVRVNRPIINSQQRPGWHW